MELIIGRRYAVTDSISNGQGGHRDRIRWGRYEGRYALPTSRDRSERHWFLFDGNRKRTPIWLPGTTFRELGDG